MREQWSLATGFFSLGNSTLQRWQVLCGAAYQQWPHSIQPLLCPVALHYSTCWSSHLTGFPNRSPGRIDQITVTTCDNREDPGRLSSPIFYSKQGQNWFWVRLLRASSSQILKTSKDRDFITSLAILIQCLGITIVIFFLSIQLKLFLFQFMIMVSHSGPINLCKEPGSAFFVTSL